MIRILLACAGGMSTSLLMNKMEQEAKKRGIEVSVDAVGEKSVEERMWQFDVLLLGPQVRYVVKSIEKLLEGKAPFAVIGMREYGMMDGKKVLDQALKLYEDFYK